MARVLLAVLICISCRTVAAEPLTIGLNYPATGNHKWLGLSQMRGALMAVAEINEAGGVAGRMVKLVHQNSGGRPEKAVANVDQMAALGAVMVMGGASSAEVIAAGLRSKSHGLPYFVPMAYASEVTAKEGHKYIFREGASAHMANNVLMEYLATTMPGSHYFIITSDDVITKGRVGSLLVAARSKDISRAKHYREALSMAVKSDAQILVLMLYGNDAVDAMRVVGSLGLKDKMLVVIPNLQQEVVEQVGAGLMEGVIGTDTWTWQSPEREGNERGKTFVRDFAKRYGSYPSSSAASTYAIVYQWADAVRRAKTSDGPAVIAALEDHSYTLLKDEQKWRAVDHQNLQSMYVVKVRPREEVMKDSVKQDYFEVLHWMEGEVAAPTEKEIRYERSPEGWTD
ncbi:branched-chain amino acid ABC transporter substrate-binding protein [Stutzerimonas xanthomarina]|jgi:branched-chain amino acid transport system substrate-binding protein|uniref:Branched-chain amino acid ABC transporter substrate-binding protein n=1 Tax=Stutzerimonas xanthomarina TaxID=271420 RepID=A0A3R8U7U9_9GAMM|nr:MULTISPECIES: ABC transporter substrate-binding protein [Stutzerimonas]MCW8158357.1 branched-chain amino acid ABC transporter substrate-binding protein [Stutzerimonas stutzeri]RRV13484.1 branched-chain amino acid ABC transporter substrate-binding protein [Stutzerimonas xanthomarina]